MGFAPSSVTFVTPITAGTGSPVHTVTVSNTTNASLPITGISIVGTNPKNFIRSADTCSGTTLTPNGASSTCTVNVEFTPSAAGQRTALLQVNDSGPIAPHSHEVTLTGTGLYPNDPKSVRGTVGCSSVRITWVSPTATRYAGIQVVRNHAHFPTSPADGTTVPHTAVGVAVDKGLKHFTTYYYRVFARYHSLTHPGSLNYSAGVHFKEHTGEICTPQNGARSQRPHADVHLASLTDPCRLFVRARAQWRHHRWSATHAQRHGRCLRRGTTITGVHRLNHGIGYTFYPLHLSEVASGRCH